MLCTHEGQLRVPVVELDAQGLVALGESQAQRRDGMVDRVRHHLADAEGDGVEHLRADMIRPVLVDEGAGSSRGAVVGQQLDRKIGHSHTNRIPSAEAAHTLPEPSRSITRLSEAARWYREPMHEHLADREQPDRRAEAAAKGVGPTRIAVANDYEIVVAGLAAMLEREDDIEVVDMFVVGEEGPSEPIDVVLYDTFGRDGVDHDQLQMLVRTPLVQHVVVFTLSWDDSLTEAALQEGVTGVLSKALKGDELAAHIREIATGAVVVAAPPHGRIVSGTGRDWPGRSFGLSERESECLVLLAAGLRNAEIGRSLYVSEDTVKTHLKRAYRKLGVGNRAQATAIVLRHPSFVGPPPTLQIDDRFRQSAAAASSSVPASANERHRPA